MCYYRSSRPMDSHWRTERILKWGFYKANLPNYPIFLAENHHNIYLSTGKTFGTFHSLDILPIVEHRGSEIAFNHFRSPRVTPLPILGKREKDFILTIRSYFALPNTDLKVKWKQIYLFLISLFFSNYQFV